MCSSLASIPSVHDRFALSSTGAGLMALPEMLQGSALQRATGNDGGDTTAEQTEMTSHRAACPSSSCLLGSRTRMEAGGCARPLAVAKFLAHTPWLPVSSAATGLSRKAPVVVAM